MTSASLLNSNMYLSFDMMSLVKLKNRKGVIVDGFCQAFSWKEVTLLYILTCFQISHRDDVIRKLQEDLNESQTQHTERFDEV